MNRNHPCSLAFSRLAGIGLALFVAVGTVSAESFPFDDEIPAVGIRRNFDVEPPGYWISPERKAGPIAANAEEVDRSFDSETDAEVTVEHSVAPNPFENPEAVVADWEEGDSLTPGFGPNSEPMPYMGRQYAPCRQYDSCQWLPSGLLYKSYLAGEKEPRFASAWLHDRDLDWVWESTLGGRVGLFRNGTVGAVNPEGWQLDIEGAAMPRLNMQQQEDLEAVDFRFGIPLTWRHGRVAYKVGYYHISSHIGDEYLVRNPGFVRRNYVRDSAIAGISYDIDSDLRVYGEIAYAFSTSGGAEPLELQFGGEYSPSRANPSGDPFFAANVHLREEFDFGGAINIMTGWQWRGATSNRLARVGLQYYNGKSLQYSFFDQNEQLAGLGIWVDY